MIYSRSRELVQESYTFLWQERAGLLFAAAILLTVLYAIDFLNGLIGRLVFPNPLSVPTATGRVWGVYSPILMNVIILYLHCIFLVRIHRGVTAGALATWRSTWNIGAREARYFGFIILLNAIAFAIPWFIYSVDFRVAYDLLFFGKHVLWIVESAPIYGSFFLIAIWVFGIPAFFLFVPILHDTAQGEGKGIYRGFRESIAVMKPRFAIASLSFIAAIFPISVAIALISEVQQFGSFALVDSSPFIRSTWWFAIGLIKSFGSFLELALFAVIVSSVAMRDEPDFEAVFD
jgi:hypothetical protein